MKLHVLNTIGAVTRVILNNYVSAMARKTFKWNEHELDKGVKDNFDEIV